MKNNGFRVYLILLSAVALMSEAQATWCLPTHLVFKEELTKMDKSGEPFRIGTLDKDGYALAVVKGSSRLNYRYLRNVQIDGYEFREFRSGAFKFLLSIPQENGVMPYREIMVDDGGVERGFGGYCS